MFKRVLVPLDGSKRAEEAIPVAAHLARSADGTLIFLRVVPIYVQYAPYLATGPVTPPARTELDAEDAQRYLAEVAVRADLAGIRVEQDVVAGPPGPLILDAVYERGADAVVLCSHGRTGFTRWALGSVAQHLARHAPVPVLVLHQGGADAGQRETAATAPARVLVPLDGSALAEQALPGALELARALGGAEAAVHLFMAVDYYATVPNNAPQGKALDAAKKYLSEASETLSTSAGGAQPVRITWSAVAAEDVAVAILQMAERGGESDRGEIIRPSAAIAMATHGRGGVARLALGSVTERVLEGTRLPLLIVRAHTASADDAHVMELDKYAASAPGKGMIMPPAWRRP